MDNDTYLIEFQRNGSITINAPSTVQRSGLRFLSHVKHGHCQRCEMGNDTLEIKHFRCSNVFNRFDMWHNVTFDIMWHPCDHLSACPRTWICRVIMQSTDHGNTVGGCRQLRTFLPGSRLCCNDSPRFLEFVGNVICKTYHMPAQDAQDALDWENATHCHACKFWQGAKTITVQQQQQELNRDSRGIPENTTKWQSSWWFIPKESRSCQTKQMKHLHRTSTCRIRIDHSHMGRSKASSSAKKLPSYTSYTRGTAEIWSETLTF